MKFPTPPPLPREHGAWMMLAIPIPLGAAAGGAGSGAAWMVPVATGLVFLAHHAVVPWAQRTRERKASPPGYAARRLVWGAIDLAAAVVVFACAVLAAHPGARGPLLTIAVAAAALAAVYAAGAVFGHGRSIPVEILGMAGVSLGGPMMAAAAGRPLDRALFGSAALALGYFLSSLAFVRAQERTGTDRVAAAARCVAAHVVLAAALAAAAGARVVPAWWWAAFVPVAARTAWGLADPPETLRRLGIREIGVALTFTLIAAVVLAWPGRP